MSIDFAAIAKPRLLHGAVWCLLASAALTYAPRIEAADPVPCSISPLKKLMALDGKGFEARKEPLTGHSTEGGTLTILSRKALPQRARAELFGETGRVAVEVGYLGSDLISIVRWTEYVEPLPKMPVRTKKVDTLAGFVCSGVLILDRESGDTGKDKVADFERLTRWLLGELKSRGVTWSVQLPAKK